MKSNAVIKLLSLILTIIMLLSPVSIFAFAASNINAQAITGVTMNGKTATVNYSAPNGAKLVSAVYDQSGRKMFTSCIKEVSGENGKETVDFDMETLPRYFTVKCFLLGENNSPLCPVYVYESTNFGSLPETKTGDIIEFGSYPQSQVEDPATLNALNKMKLTWISYKYYFDENLQSDEMRYADTTYNGERYRAVYFKLYRPTREKYEVAGSYQQRNSYFTDTLYWFKFEPIKWRVLDPNTGLVLSETCIDSQPLDYKYENINYEECSIRKWLNNDFYSLAFSAQEKEHIIKTEVDSTKNLLDNVTLLNRNEIQNTAYGFTADCKNIDPARTAKSSDYAKSQGCHTNYTHDEFYGKSNWLLRTETNYPFVEYVSACGDWGEVEVNNASMGTRPALTLNLSQNSLTPLADTTESSDNEPICKFTYSSCQAGNDYLVLNITNYGNGFELTSENLQFIDIIKANQKGKLSANFEPKAKQSDSTTLLIGNFGNGVEAKAMTAQTIDQKAYIKSFSLSQEKLKVKCNNYVTLDLNIDMQGEVDYTVEYTSSDPKVVKIDENNNIQAYDRGKATVYVTVTDPNGQTFTDSCDITVKYTFGQWLMHIFFFWL